MRYRIKNEPGTPYFSETGDAVILITSRTGATAAFDNCYYPNIWKLFKSRAAAEKYLLNKGYKKGAY